MLRISHCATDFLVFSGVFYGDRHIKMGESIFRTFLQTKVFALCSHFCSPNQWTGFHMIGTSVMKELTSLAFEKENEFFLDVSRYSTFQLSVWKGSCIKFFKLQIPQTSPTPFWKALTLSFTLLTLSFAKESKN